MKVVIADSKQDLGQQAAQHGADLLRRALKKNGTANIIVATGASQFEMLATLTREKIDWPKVTAFHLDEYVGLTVTHPASFRKYLWERFVSKLPLPLANFHFLNAEDNPAAECKRLGKVISKVQIDVAFIGIGENGHIAFNDPPADFKTSEPYIVVELDEACRRQQLGEGWFKSLKEVPRRAISMSVKQIMKSKSIVCSVPDRRKAEAVKNSLEGSVTPLTPASILQKHRDATIYLEPESASLLRGAKSMNKSLVIFVCSIAAILLPNSVPAASIVEETFSSTTLDAAWKQHTSTHSTIALKNGWITFTSLPGEQSHIERACDQDLITLSASLARWASIYLVWDEHTWCGVGKTSQTPFGRFTSLDVHGGKATEIDHRGIDFGGRNEVRIQLGVDHVTFQYMLDGRWTDLRTIERRKEFAGPSRLIVAGQSYVADDKPFGVSGSAIDTFNQHPTGAIDELRVEPTPAELQKLSDLQIDAIRHPPPEPVSALLAQNDDDPTFDKIAPFYPPFRRPREIVGVPEHRDEIGVDYLGRLDVSPWAAPKAWFLIGQKLEPFGQPKVAFERRLLDGYLPLVTLTRGSNELTVFGWSEDFAVDRATWAYVRFRTPKKVTLAWGDDDKSRRSFEGPVAYFRFKWPQPQTVAAITAEEFEVKQADYIDRWRKRIEPATRFDVPDARVMNAYRAWIVYSMLDADTINGFLEPHDGAGFYDSMFGNSVSLHAIAMDQLGLHDYAERILAMQCHYQKPDGLYLQDCGLVDPGGFIAGLAKHYQLTGDRAFLQRVAPNIVRQCDWIIAQRKAAPTDGMLRGLIKFRPYNDYPQPVYNYLGNAWCAQGMKWAAEALADIDDPHASTYATEAQRFRADILDSMQSAAFERDGMMLLPMEPDTHRLLKMTKYAGGDYWGLVASPLLATGILDPRDQRAQWIIDMLEKRQGLIAGVCEFHGGIDHAYTFGYLDTCLARGEVRKTLLGFWSFLAFGMTRDTFSPVEVSIIQTGENELTLPHLYSCTEQLRLLRNLLVREEGDTLWLAPGAPRAWLEPGKHIAVNQAPTEFGDVTYRIESNRDHVHVTIDPPERRMPAQIRLRLRDPRRRTIASVVGADAVDFKDAMITIHAPKAPLSLTVHCAP